MKEYRRDIDLLKGIAILAVVLYHIGFLKSGYLGVDIFLLVNGFLVIPSIVKKIENKEFKYFSFLIGKYIRLAPLVIILCAVVMVIGFFGMVPDDYENLSQSVIACLVFSQNVLSAITTKDYWNVVNEYKPLMHFWYLGILMEFYLIIPLVLMGLKKLSDKINKKYINIAIKGLTVLTIVSLSLFLFTKYSVGDKFYYIFFRIWELTLGGIVYYIMKRFEFKSKSANIVKIASFVLIVIVLLIGVVNTNYSTLWSDHVVPIGSKKVYDSNLIIPNSIAIIISIVLSSIYIIISKYELKCKIIENIGKMSYSIFVWHQPILAFYRYFIKYELTIPVTIVYLFITAGASYLSYTFIEKKIKNNKICVISCILSSGLIGIVSLIIYLNAGVVRDVPELNISKDNIHYKMHAEYVDRIYDFDKDYEENNKINVLVIGNSFARDFANVIIESDIYEDINLSYIYSLDEKYIERLSKTNCIFYFGYKSDIPDYFWNNIKSDCKVYGIGTKNYGESNGTIYSKRFNKDYFEQKIKLNSGYKVLNEELKNEWGNNYIDLIEIVKDDDENISIFTDDNKFISQDCHHLTQSGAIFYAKMLNLKKLVKE